MNSSYAAWLAVSGGAAIFVAYLSWQQRRTAPVARALFFLMLALAFWSLSYAASWAASSDETGIFWLKVTYVGAVAAPVAFFVTALSFTNRYSWLSRRVYAALMTIPVLTLVLLWTDSRHHLFFGNYPLQARGSIFNGGPWFYVNVFYLYGLVLAGIVLLVDAYWRASQLYRKQARVMAAGALFPWLVNILLLLGRNPASGLDWTPLAFTATGILFAYGIFGYRMLELIPVSRDALVENLDEAIVVLDIHGRIVDINPKALEFADPGVDHPLGRALEEVFSRWGPLLERYANLEGRAEFKLESPPFFYIELKIVPLRDRQSNLVGKLAAWRDITARKVAEERLRIFHRAVDQNPVAVVITDMEGYIEYTNPRFTELTGYAPEEARGRNPRFLQSGETAHETYATLWSTIKSGGVWAGEIQNRKKNGETYWAYEMIAPVLDAEGRITHFVAMQQDISYIKRSQEELSVVNARLQAKLTEVEILHDQLREEAIHDGLTRLHNRRYMEEALDREILRAERDVYPISVVMMDVDLFKTINDTNGHQAGDSVLQTLGTLLLENTRVSDIACRYGGDEMVVVMPGAAREIAVARAEEWRAAFSHMEFHFADGAFKTTLSLGVATFPDHARNPVELLSVVDKALYWAKTNRNQVVLYDPSTIGRGNQRSNDIR